MARTRNLKPAFFKNEDLADLPVQARLLFAGLWCWADREGRLEDRPRRLKAEIMPYDDVDVDYFLSLLAEPPGNFISRYEVDGMKYLTIPGFTTHQNPHKAEQASLIPAPTGGVPDMQQPRTVDAPDNIGSCRALSLPPSSLTLNPSTSNAREKSDDSKPKPPKQAKKPKPPYPPEFEEWWKVYPRKEGKAAAFKQWKSAVAAIQVFKSLPPRESQQHLLKVTKSYAKSPAGLAVCYVPHPERWLSKARYDDDPKAWERKEDHGKHMPGPGQRYTPGVGDSETPTF